MRVYGKEELEQNLWSNIVKARDEYFTKNNKLPDYLELTKEEFEILKNYLFRIIPAVKVDTNFLEWSVMNMKLVIKD